ncbi:MAG: ribonuclease HIII [Bacilli bacterium]|nr:ribonuclease HIII [Bacilli bacterium]
MVITLKTCKKTQEMMQEFYEETRRPKTPQYALFQADDGDTVVTLYESGKAVFQGVDADLSSDYWIETEKINSGSAIVTNSETKKKEELKGEKPIDYSIYHNVNSVGSDEVGTGDYFGPIVVTSCYVTKDDVSYLDELGVCDSKKLTDEKILKIAPLIAKRVKYKSIILSNKEYNQYHHNEYNMNKIKAIMHNKVLYQMIKEENPHYDYIIVDEFAKENRYYEYIKDSTNIQRNITFMTKAEDKCLSVACASIISRYLFIKEFDKLSDSLHIPLPKGASKEVDKVGMEIVEKYGKEKLFEVAKLNFMNTERILQNKIV